MRLFKKNCCNCKYLDYDDDGGDYSLSFPVCKKYPLESRNEIRMTDSMQKEAYFLKGKRCCEFELEKCFICEADFPSHFLISNHDGESLCYDCCDGD